MVAAAPTAGPSDAASVADDAFRRGPMTTGLSVARSALFTVAMRWTDRTIGVVSTIVLARLLAPADFGIIAMATLVIGLVDVFLDLGVNIALIQRASLIQAHYDSAWTMRLAQTALATLVVVVAAPFAARYFNDPRIQPVLQVMGLSLLLTGLENIGIVEFQKTMQFGRDFQFEFAKRIAGFVATLVAAWIMRSYWSLVVGMLAGRAFGVLISYRLHPMRPRLSVDKARELFGVSQWTLIKGIGDFLEQNLHRWVVGGREPASVMGAYSVADDIAYLPSSTLLIPLNRVLFPAFVQVKEDVAELKRIFLLAQAVQSLIGIPVAVGLMLVADEAVRVLLGDKWLAAVRFVELLAIVRVVAAVTTSAGYLLTALGKFRTLAAFSWTRVGLFAFAAYVLLGSVGAIGIAVLRASFVAVSLALFVFWIRHALPGVQLREMAASVARPAIAAVAMTACVLSLDRFVALPPLSALLLKAFVGALAYTGTVLVLWRAAGRPAGAESYLLEKLALLRR